MSPLSPKSAPLTRQDSPQMHPSLLQHMPPNAALNTRGTGTALPQPNLSADVAQSPLSPSDCRTLKKILEDVQGPFPTASPLSIKHNENHLGAEYTQDSSSDTSNEDEVQHMENCYDYGDEVDEGYEDEDGSMNLSDTVEESRDDNAVQEDQSMFIDEDDSRGYAWSDGDTIEDIMNMPGETAPLAPQQDLGVDLHDQPLSDANKEIKLKRATVEAVLEQERLDQEHQDAAAIGDGIIDLDATHVGGQDDAVVLSDDPEFWAVEAVQAEIGMSLIENNVVRVVEFEYFEPFDRRASRCFSPTSTLRRASADPVPSPSFIGFSESRPAVMSTPSGRHLAFTPSSAVPGTPFTKTLNYSKEQKSKENSPSKGRRKTSLPEEIAELVCDMEKEDDLEKYRDRDLAPMESVMESSSAGDLITFGAPARARIPTSGGDITCSDKPSQRAAFPNTSTFGVTADTSPVAAVLEKLVPIESAGAHSSLSSGLSLPIEQDEDSDANSEKSNTTSNPENKQLKFHPQHPTFVTIIGLLPKAFFWAAAAPVAKYSTQAYDALVNKFAGIELSAGGVRGE